MQEKTTVMALKIAVIVIASLLVFSVFKNIAYPLLWNDEAETAMFAKRVLEFGYPKVHDGKNIVNLFELPDKTLSIDKKTDAYIVTVWGHFYYAAIGEAFARFTDDIYLKTALLRIPFAVIGLAGILLIAFSALQFFGTDSRKRLTFLASLLFLELLSVPLILHIREVRYYSLALFLSGCVFYIYSRYFVKKKLSHTAYIISMSIVFLLLYNSFPPPYLAFSATIGIFAVAQIFKKGSLRNFLVLIAPIAISAIFVLPLLYYYKTALISKAFTEYFNITSLFRFDILRSIFSFLWRYEFLCVVLFARMASLIILPYLRSSASKQMQSKNKKNKTLLLNEEETDEIDCRATIANFLSIFFIIYIAIISRIPLPAIFERYYIFLQPLLSVVLLFDIFNIASAVRIFPAARLKKQLELIPLIIILLLFVNSFNKIGLVKEHLYEITHAYKGPLDYAIPYIRSNYGDTKNLVIATNYEECAYMYYLGSKVIIGFVGNNLAEDTRLTPDIIIFRKLWGTSGSRNIFKQLLAKTAYESVTFPVLDSPVNNIPQVTGIISHIFRFRMADNNKEALRLYRRKST